MKIMQSIVLTLFGLSLIVAVSFAVGEPSRPQSKRKLVKEDIENMMVTLSNWDRWGKDDELGTLNLITPKKRKQAAALVQDGIAVSLARNVIKSKIDGSSPFVHKMLKTGLSNDEIGAASDEYCVAYHGFTQTHMDALCHLFYKGKMYNGFSQREVTEKGAGKLSVLQIKQGVFTRGVLMDMPRLFGVKYLKGSRAIYPEDLEAWEKKEGLKVT